METVNNVLKKHVNLHPDPSMEQFESTLNGLHRLLDELARPENHELMRFVFAWERLNQELTALEIKINERLAERPINPINEFLNKLRKKN